MHASTHHTAVTALGIVCAHQCMHVKQWDRPAAIRTSISGVIGAISTAYKRYIPFIAYTYTYIYTDMTYDMTYTHCLLPIVSIHTYIPRVHLKEGGGGGVSGITFTHPLLHSCTHLPPPTPWICIKSHVIHIQLALPPLFLETLTFHTLEEISKHSTVYIRILEVLHIHLHGSRRIRQFHWFNCCIYMYTIHQCMHTPTVTPMNVM